MTTESNPTQTPPMNMLHPLRTLCLVFCFCSAVLMAQESSFSFDQLEYPFDTRLTTLSDGLKLASIESGKGKQTLVFIHGLGSYAKAWQPNMAELQAKYRCIALDLPGYGKSDKPAEQTYDLPYYVAQIADFIRIRKLKQVVLVGHSMGGQIAMLTALTHPDLVRRLVLVAPAGLELFNDNEAQMLTGFTKPEAIAATSDEQILENLKLNFVTLPEAAKYMHQDRVKMKQASDFAQYAKAVSDNVRGMLEAPVYERLGELKQPTLLLFGKQDRLIPNAFLHPNLTTEQVAQEGAKRIPNATLTLIDEAGHFVGFEKATAVNQAIQAFLK